MNTTNTLLLMEPTEIEQLLKARSTIDKIAQKRGFVSRVGSHQNVHRRSPNGSNGHNGHRPNKTRKMSQKVRDKISVGMKRRWAKRREEAKGKAAAPA